METVASIKPFIAVLISLFVVPFLILSRRPNVREMWTFIAAIAKFTLIASMLPVILHGSEIVYSLVEVLPGVGIKFRVDAFGMLFALALSPGYSQKFFAPR